MTEFIVVGGISLATALNNNEKKSVFYIDVYFTQLYLQKSALKSVQNIKQIVSNFDKNFISKESSNKIQ